MVANLTRDIKHNVVKRSFAAGAEIVEQVRINVLPSRAGINGEISQIRRNTGPDSCQNFAS